MDIKRFLPAILIAIVVAILWPKLFNTGAAGTAPKGPFAIYKDIPDHPLAAERDAKPELITLGDSSKTSKDKMAVTINTQTAGIEKVELNVNDYAQTIERKLPLTLFAATPGLAKPYSTLGIHITLGAAAKELAYGKDVTNEFGGSDCRGQWASRFWRRNMCGKSGEKSDTDVDLLMTFQLEGKPIAEVTKTFHFDPATYEITISHAVKNLTDQPLKVQIDQLGPTEMPRDDLQVDDRFFHAAGLDTTKKTVDASRFNATQVELPKFDDGTKPVGQFNDYTKDPMLWVAASNRFFATILRPLPSTAAAVQFELVDKKDIPEVTHIASANVDVMQWSATPAEALGVVRLTGAVVEVPAGTTVTEPLSAYMGPKKREILDGKYDAAPGTADYYHYFYQYVSTIQLSQSGCYQYCTWDILARGILWLLNFLTRSITFGNYGIAIMVLVILVRAALHPLTRASQINMAQMGKKMKDVQPQVEAAKKKYAGNKQKLNEETMRIYRENKVNPAGGLLGCLPMLLQMPIWAALYSGLRTDIDLRHASFIHGWINDLSRPDTILPSSLPILGHPLFTVPILGDIYGLNLLPLLLAGVFFVQMKVNTASQPKPADESQANMQKMSQYMIFIFPLFLYNAPSGLNLYIFASTMGGLLDTWLVRKTLKASAASFRPSAQTLPTHEENAD